MGIAFEEVLFANLQQVSLTATSTTRSTTLSLTSSSLFRFAAYPGFLCPLDLSLPPLHHSHPQKAHSTVPHSPSKPAESTTTTSIPMSPRHPLTRPRNPCSIHANPHQTAKAALNPTKTPNINHRPCLTSEPIPAKPRLILVVLGRTDNYVRVSLATHTSSLLRNRLFLDEFPAHPRSNQRQPQQKYHISLPSTPISHQSTSKPTEPKHYKLRPSFPFSLLIVDHQSNAHTSTLPPLPQEPEY